MPADPEGVYPVTAAEELPRVLTKWRSWLTPARCLWVAVAVFFAVSFALSWLRAVELQTTTWDEGLYQQALWSTVHGRPFFETADVETGGFGSLLQVHSVFVLFLVAPLYGLVPSQLTLFAVQSAAVALAAVPLFWLARDLTGSPKLGLVAGLAYLGWTPVLASVLYDFHPEAFLPVELFSLALLWQRARYGLGFGVAVATFLTFDIGPILVASVAVFALITPPGGSAASFPAGGAGLRHFRRSDALRRRLASPRVRASLGLLVAGIAAYETLVLVRTDYLTGLLGTYPLASAPTGYVIGSTPAAVGLSWGNFAFGFGNKLAYWLVVLGLLAFVPLLAPRALVLSLPWLGFTFFSSNLNYVTLGFQYGFIVAASGLVAFAYALPVLRPLLQRWVEGEPRSSTRRWAGAGPRTSLSLRRYALVLGVGGLLFANLALSPLDPAMQNQGLGSAYRLSYVAAPGDAEVPRLAGLIPPGATVVASDDLFPLVANDENAYSFSWIDDPTLALPFTAAHPPQYVLVAQNRLGAVLPWLAALLYNQSFYGVRAVVWSSDAGAVLLFEANFSGPAEVFGPGLASGGTYFGGALVAPGPGVVTSATGSTYPTVVESEPGTLGTFFAGPGSDDGPGQYAVTLSVRATIVPGFPPPAANTPVLWVEVSAFGVQQFIASDLNWSELNTTGWAELSYPVTLEEPVVAFTVQGVALAAGADLTLNFLRIGTQGET